MHARWTAFLFQFVRNVFRRRLRNVKGRQQAGRLNEYRAKAMLASVTLFCHRPIDFEVFQYWLTATLLFQFKREGSS